MRNSFILWDLDKHKSVDQAIESKDFRILYDYVSPTTEAYTKIKGCLKIVKTHLKNPSTIITEVPWIKIQ